MNIPKFTAEASLYGRTNRYPPIAFDIASPKRTVVIPNVEARVSRAKQIALWTAEINILIGQPHGASEVVATRAGRALAVLLPAKLTKLNATLNLLPAPLAWVHLAPHLSARSFGIFAWKTATGIIVFQDFLRSYIRHRWFSDYDCGLNLFINEHTAVYCVCIALQDASALSAYFSGFGC